MAVPPCVIDLQRACESAAVAAGYPKEERAWRSHLTLGRWGAPERFVAIPHEEPGEVRLERLVLFRSDLKPQGAVHTPLLEFPLG
jgi:2'-5' RNA ligase